MQALHITDKNPTTFSIQEAIVSDSVTEAINNLTDYLKSAVNQISNTSFSKQEVIINDLTFKLGRTALQELLQAYDIKADVINMEGQVYRKKDCSPKTYQTALGAVTLNRHTYSNRKKDGDGKSICPLELQSGIIESYWTPKAAKNAAWSLAHLTPQEVEGLLLEFGTMSPSRSSLDRLPKSLNSHWEPKTIALHQEIINDVKIPDKAVTASVSLDGVMIAMKAKPPEKQGKVNKKIPNHCEWKEASCGTISFYDEDGERLDTYQYGRMPESKKVTLKTLLRQHVEHVRKDNPKLNLVYLADGARDNWSFFEEQLPSGFELADFYHACQYLKAGFEAAYETEKANEQFEKYKLILRDDTNGINKTLRAFRYLKEQNPESEVIRKTVIYLKNNQHRMNYAKAQELNYPIGSGVVEASCKTLVGQRLKRSGMSWEIPGGQAILTLRSLVKSNFFESAWGKIAAFYKKDINVYENVINLPV